jgi:D-cysteine desulfhydrase
MAEQAERLAAAGHRALVIPEGGSDATGAWGYVRGLEEICDQLAAAGDAMDVLVHPAGSGGTTAGLAIGAHWLGWEGELIGVPVCDDGPYFDGVVQAIAADMRAAGYDATPAPVRYPEEYKGEAYAVPYESEMDAVRNLARTEGIICDPVYSGKALAGLVGELEAGRISKDKHIVFLHTGGIFGAMAQPEAYL